MAVMIASGEFGECLYAFVFGYARFDLKSGGKRIYLLLPFLYPPVLTVISLVALIIILLRRRKAQRIEVEPLTAPCNEGILISEEKVPGVLAGGKDDLPRLLEVAIDRLVARRGVTPNHIFFLLNGNDLDIFSDDLLEVIGDKQVWLFVEAPGKKEVESLRRIGKLILFDREFMERRGIPLPVLGIIPRFLSMISGEGGTTLEHIHASLPEITTVSYVFPADAHASIASMLKHQRHLCAGYGEVCLSVTNSRVCTGKSLSGIRYVRADTEVFLITFRRCLRCM